MNIKYWIERAWVGLTNPFRKTLTATICGHETKQQGLITVFEKTSTIMSMPIDENGHTEYCLTCIGKMSIRCAWCGGSIIVSDPVTLYQPVETFEVPEYAVRYHEDESRLVGCLRWDCADTGAHMCGHWMPPGKVERCPSPLELALAGNMVVVPDIKQYPNGVSTIPCK